MNLGIGGGGHNCKYVRIWEIATVNRHHMLMSRESTRVGQIFLKAEFGGDDCGVKFLLNR